MEGKRVLITGATGFIGSRLVERIISTYSENVEIWCMTRDFAKTARLSRYDLNWVFFDLSIGSHLNELNLPAFDYVFHCAYGSKGSLSARKLVNVSATQALLEWALTAKVKAFLYLSTVSVYNLALPGEINEELEYTRSTQGYEADKREGEKIVLSYQAKGLNVVVLQPTAVYGPWAISYGLRLIQQLKNNRFPLIDGAKGTCNAVFVDDLTDAMLLSIVNERAYGQRFLINGPNYITWAEFYQYFAQLCNGHSPAYISFQEYNLIKKSAVSKNAFFKEVLKVIKVDKQQLKHLYSKNTWARPLVRFVKYLGLVSLVTEKKNSQENDVSEQTEASWLIISDDHAKFINLQVKVTCGQAANTFGYKPIVGFEEGFAKTKAWYDWFTM